MLDWWTVDINVHVIHISHILYIATIIFPHIGNKQSTVKIDIRAEGWDWNSLDHETV